MALVLTQSYDPGSWVKTDLGHTGCVCPESQGNHCPSAGDSGVKNTCSRCRQTYNYAPVTGGIIDSGCQKLGRQECPGDD